jgi:predicted Zn-dependent peptidase
MGLIPQQNIRIERMPISTIKTAYISIGFRTCSRFNEDKYTLDLLRILMGGKFTSRLTMLLREKNGLTYTSNVSTTYYEHSGDITIFSITDSENIMHNYQHKRTQERQHYQRKNKTPKKRASISPPQKHIRKTTKNTNGGGRKTDKRGVLPIICDMLRDLIRRGITETELKESKMYMDGMIKMNISKGTKQTEYNGMEWFLGNTEKITPYTELYKTRFEPITKSDINRLIRKYFTPENMNVVLVGSNLPDKIDIERLL